MRWTQAARVRAVAAKRMFAKAVIQSARFLRLPQSSQLLYFFLGLEADDDGFTETFPVFRLYGMEEEDLNPLIESNFVQVVNDDLVVFITDWRRNNNLRRDCYTESEYHNLLEQLQPENEQVTRRKRDGNATETKRKRDVNGADTQLRKEKSSKEEVSPEKKNVAFSSVDGCKKTPHGRFNNVFLSNSELAALTLFVGEDSVDDAPNTKKVIDDFSEMKERTGRRFDSDYDAIAGLLK
ncbi:MAG: hypothetical protein LUD78_03270 [Clostridiales bacterium]|nr:hypothetical protein [Clostridiales bacterium]